MRSIQERVTLLENPVQSAPNTIPLLGRKETYLLAILVLAAGLFTACMVVMVVSKVKECQRVSISTQDLISGDYILISHDEEYKEFLASMGVPAAVQTLLLAT